MAAEGSAHHQDGIFLSPWTCDKLRRELKDKLAAAHCGQGEVGGGGVRGAGAGISQAHHGGEV